MANYQPPPTYAEVVVIDDLTGKARFNPIWLKWFIELASTLGASGGAGGAISHEALSDLQGGAANNHYHVTSAQATALLAVVAAFTGTGSTVRQTTPTLVTPILGVATGTSIGLSGGITTGNTTLHTTTVNLANGAAAAGGTLLNAPAAGNPTKWIPIDDNGTVRYVPAW